MKRKKFESYFQLLKGKILTKVKYFEIEYENGNSYWNYESSFDSLDYGLDLYVSPDKCFGIIWDSDFHQYGISLKENSLKKELVQFKETDVTTVSRWKNLIGQKIISVQLVWSWVKEIGVFKKKIYYPQDLILTFQNEQKVYISALEIRENDFFFGMADNITVIFNEDVAKKFKVSKHI